MPRPKGTKNKPGHRAGRPKAGRTANPPRISQDAMGVFRDHAAKRGQSIGKSIEEAAEMLRTSDI